MAFSIAVSNWLASFQVLGYMQRQTSPTSQQLVPVGQSLEPMIQSFKSWVIAARSPPVADVKPSKKGKRKRDGEAGGPPRKRSKSGKSKAVEPEASVSPVHAPAPSEPDLWGTPEVSDAELLAACTSGPVQAEELSAIDELLKSLGP